jgi:transcription termination factor Rho
MTEVRLLSEDEIAQARPARKRATKAAADTATVSPTTPPVEPAKPPAKARTRPAKAEKAAENPTVAQSPQPTPEPTAAASAVVTPAAPKRSVKTSSKAAVASTKAAEPDVTPAAKPAATRSAKAKSTATRKTTTSDAGDAAVVLKPVAKASETVQPAVKASESVPAGVSEAVAPASDAANDAAKPVRRTARRRTTAAPSADAPAAPVVAAIPAPNSREVTPETANPGRPAAPGARTPNRRQPAQSPRESDVTSYTEPPKTTPIAQPTLFNPQQNGGQSTAQNNFGNQAPAQSNPGGQQPATFRPQQSGQNRPPAQFRPAGQQQRPQQGQRPQQPFAPRNQGGQPGQSQANDIGNDQGDNQRGRRRRRRRGRGANGNPMPMNAGGAPVNGGTMAPTQSFEERAPLVEFIPQQRMPVFEVHGILDFLPNGEAFLREEDLRVRSDDPLIGVRDLRRFDMRNGDIVQIEARPGRGRGPVTVERVISVNDVPFEQVRTRPRFEDLTPIYPDRMIKLETGQQPVTTRMLDMIAPVGFGQRALIVSPPKAGKTTVLKHIGQGVLTNYPEASLILCLVGERPEEVTDLRISLPKAIMFASSFDEEVERHGHLAEMALERARRLAEQGKDVVVLLDSITRLARAYNLGPSGGGGRTLSGGMDASALTTARRIFGAARAIEQGGSLTIIATCLVDTGSRLDDVVYEEFKGTGNMELHLDRALAERRIFPAIDIAKSSTRKEELLLDPVTLQWVVLLRRRLAGAQAIQATEQFIDRLSKTPSNKVFLDLLSRTQS